MTGKVGGPKSLHPGKSVKNMEVEQRYVIKFFTDEGTPRIQIISRLRDHYGEDALSQTQIYCWINEIKRGRTDSNNSASPEREPDEGLAGVIAAKLDADPHLSARKLAQPLGISASAVSRYLTKSWESTAVTCVG
jgi:DNA-binding transcriptional ArsR family regulator